MFAQFGVPLFTTTIVLFVLPFICLCKQSDEWSWSRMLVDLPTIDLYKCKYHCLVIVACVFLFTLILAEFIVAFLFTYLSSFFSSLLLVYFLLVFHMKKIPYFWFCSFCLQFKRCERKNTIAIFVTIVIKNFSFVQ